MNDYPIYSVLPLNTKRSHVVRTTEPRGVRLCVAADPNAEGEANREAEVYVTLPRHLACHAAAALNAAERGVTLKPGLVLLVSDIRDGRAGNRAVSWQFPSGIYTHPDAARELARRTESGWKPNLPTR